MIINPFLSRIFDCFIFNYSTFVQDFSSLAKDHCSFWVC